MTAALMLPVAWSLAMFEQCPSCRPAVATNQQEYALLYILGVPPQSRVFINDQEVSGRTFYVPKDYFGMYVIRIFTDNNGIRAAYNCCVHITKPESYHVDIKAGKFFKGPPQIESSGIIEYFAPGSYTLTLGDGTISKINVSERGEFEFSFDFGLKRDPLEEQAVYAVIGGEKRKIPLGELKSMLNVSANDVIFVVSNKTLYNLIEKQKHVRVPNGVSIVYVTKDWQASMLGIPFVPASYLRRRGEDIIKLADSDDPGVAIEEYLNIRSAGNQALPAAAVAATMVLVGVIRRVTKNATGQ